VIYFVVAVQGVFLVLVCPNPTKSAARRRVLEASSTRLSKRANLSDTESDKGPNSGNTDLPDYDDDAGWTFFPDGFFERTFTFNCYKLHKNLRVHWPTQTLGTKRNPGSQDATDPKAGKLTERKCLGTMKCDTCRALTRPQTTPQMRRKQLAAGCYCGGELRLVPCEGHVVSKIYTFRHGVHYVNGGFHLHEKPTHLIALDAEEDRALEERVKENPKAGPSQLLFGDRSVTKISPLLFNKDRLAYERTRILKPTRVFKDNHFLEQIAAFEHRHPNFAPRVYIEGKVTVIVLQSPFMRRMLLKDTVEDDAVNGIVSDASHGFFKQRNELLMVSSVFEPKNLQCWVPAMMSYFNGSTVDHYRIHFFHLLRSIAEECDDTDETIHIVSDDMFASVIQRCF
jgi:hypothetical protein